MTANLNLSSLVFEQLARKTLQPKFEQKVTRCRTNSENWQISQL